jgi:hypothetical protein
MADEITLKTALEAIADAATSGDEAKLDRVMTGFATMARAGHLWDDRWDPWKAQTDRRLMESRLLWEVPPCSHQG